MKENALNNYKTINETVDYVQNSIEVYTLATIIKILDNVCQVQVSYKIKKNNNINKQMVIECRALNKKFGLFPYNVGDLVVVFFPRIRQDLIIDNGVLIFDTDTEALHCLSSGIIFGNFVAADLANRDIVTVPNGKSTITINKNGEMKATNSTSTVEIGEDNKITVTNGVATMSMDSSGKIEIVNNQANGIILDADGRITMQNLLQGSSLLTVLNKIAECLGAALPNPALTPPNDLATKITEYQQEMMKFTK